MTLDITEAIDTSLYLIRPSAFLNLHATGKCLLCLASVSKHVEMDERLSRRFCTAYLSSLLLKRMLPAVLSVPSASAHLTAFGSSMGFLVHLEQGAMLDNALHVAEHVGW